MQNCLLELSFILLSSEELTETGYFPSTRLHLLSLFYHLDHAGCHNHLINSIYLMALLQKCDTNDTVTYQEVGLDHGNFILYIIPYIFSRFKSKAFHMNDVFSATSLLPSSVIYCHANPWSESFLLSQSWYGVRGDIPNHSWKVYKIGMN